MLGLRSCSKGNRAFVVTFIHNNINIQGRPSTSENTCCHPPKRFNKYRRALRLIRLVEAAATSPFVPLEGCLTLTRNVIHNMLLQCSNSSAFLAAICRSTIISFIWSCHYPRWCFSRQARISSKLGSVYSLSTVIRITWEHWTKTFLKNSSNDEPNLLQ